MPGQALPPWSGADIGSFAVAGTERIEDGCISLFAAIPEIDSEADDYHFTYVEKEGDLQFVAQITDELWRPGASAGIMLRESLKPDSRFALFGAHYYPVWDGAGQQIRLLSRKAPGLPAEVSPGSVVGFSELRYLKLLRSGTNVAGYSSLDGKTWELHFSARFPELFDKLFAGLSVSGGHWNGGFGAARFTFCHIDFDVAPGWGFHRRDADDNGELQLSDAISILRFLFQGQDMPRCLDAADADDNGALELVDALIILRYLFQGRDPPALPLPPGVGPCGADVDFEHPDLGCESYSHCK